MATKVVGPQFGDKCQCGAVVIEARRRRAGEDQFVVLAHWVSKYQPWVVWDVYDRGMDGQWIVGNGNYYSGLENAIERLLLRSAGPEETGIFGESA